MDEHSLRSTDVSNLRRSWACTRQLTAEQTERVLREFERVLKERERLIAVLDELRAGPWPETRRLLGKLHGAVERR